MNNATLFHPNGISRYNDIKPLIGLSRSTVWNLVRQGKFPKPKRLSHKCTVWRNADILAWIEKQGANDE